jgi:hypothetical protein
MVEDRVFPIFKNPSKILISLLLPPHNSFFGPSQFTNDKLRYSQARSFLCLTVKVAFHTAQKSKDIEKTYFSF